MKTIRNVYIIFLAAMIFTSGIFAQGKTYSKKYLIKEIELATFHEIEISGLAEVNIKQGSHPKAVLEVSGMPIEEVELKVENGVLFIGTQENYSGESVRISITYNEINSLLVADSAELFSKGALKTSSLEVVVLDRASAKLEVDVDLVSIWMNDSADLTLSGNAKKQNILSRSENGTLTNQRLSNIK